MLIQSNNPIERSGGSGGSSSMEITETDPRIA